MKTKAQYEAANANYWVGCGGTVNKGRSVRRALPSLGLGALRPTFLPTASLRLPGGSPKGSILVPHGSSNLRGQFETNAVPFDSRNVY